MRPIQHDPRTNTPAPAWSKYHAVGWSFFLLFCVLGLDFYAKRRNKRQIDHLTREYLYESVKGLGGSADILTMVGRQTDLGEGNQELGACLGLGGLCRITSPDQQMQFAMRRGLDLAEPILIGTLQHPAPYNRLGKLGCDDESAAECPAWSVIAWFWAECPEPSAADKSEPEVTEPQQLPKTCPKAAKIMIRHQVKGLGPCASMASLPSQQFLDDNKSAHSLIVMVPK